MVSFRLDPRLRGRVDAADVMQEAFIAATARRAEFFQAVGAAAVPVAAVDGRQHAAGVAPASPGRADA